MTEGHLLGGKYQLLRRIAQGGMAEVYLARQTGLEGFEKLVVIKRILPHLVENDEFVAMFLDEARTAADLRHPNVVQIFEIGEDAGTYFIAMEFLHGQDVRRVMRRQAEAGARIPLGHALQVIIDAANGLDHAHKKTDLQGRPLGIIHRDISPQNIIVTYDGTTKIVDFGIAKAASQSTQTASGVLKGKYSYMSPEQAAGQVLDQRTDQFALGIVLYEMVTMSRLFKHQSDILTLHAVTECDVKPPSSVMPGFPRELDQIVMKALARDRKDRFPDCQALAMALEEFMAQERLVHSPARLSVYMKELFAETLQKEKAQGQVLIPTETSEAALVDSGSPGTSRARPSTQSRRRAAAEPTRARSASGTPQPATPPPSAPVENAADEADMQEAHTQVTSSMVPPPSSADAFRDAPTQAASPSRVRQSGASSPYTPHSAINTAVAQAAAPGGARRLFLAGLGISAALALAAVAGVAWVRGAGTSSVVVRTTPPGASLSVDGVARAEVTPTILQALRVGRTYALRAELPGYSPGVAAFTVTGEPGQEVALALEKDVPRTLLVLTSTPPGAGLFLDGKPLEEKTPHRLSVPLDQDTHVVTFTLEGHGDETRRFTHREGRTEISATLQQMDASEGQARLNITSNPEGAAILVGGKPVGTAPLKGVLVAGGRSHAVVARLAGHEPQERLVDVEKNATVDVAFELERERADSGFLTLDCDVEAQVFTDKGRLLGRTPLKRVKVPAGTLGIRLVNDKKGLDYADKVTITAEREETRTIKVPTGRIKVVVDPWADVYVDGVKVGTTPMAPRKVYAGRHEVRLVNGKLGKDEKITVQVRANADEKVTRAW